MVLFVACGLGKSIFADEMTLRLKPNNQYLVGVIISSWFYSSWLLFSLHFFEKRSKGFYSLKLKHFDFRILPHKDFRSVGVKDKI